MHNLLKMLGLAKKAGALEIGTNNVVNSIKSQKAKLVVITVDISDNTKKLITDKAKYRNVKTITVPVTMEELAKAFGKSVTSSVAITDINFVFAIIKQLKIDKTDSQSGQD